MAAGTKQLAGKKASKSASKGAVAGAAGVAGWPARLSAYYEEVKREMRLVTWPGREQVQATTAVVIITVFIFGVYFGVVDYILAMLQTRVYQYFLN